MKLSKQLTRSYRQGLDPIFGGIDVVSASLLLALIKN